MPDSSMGWGERSASTVESKIELKEMESDVKRYQLPYRELHRRKTEHFVLSICLSDLSFSQALPGSELQTGAHSHKWQIYT